MLSDRKDVAKIDAQYLGKGAGSLSRTPAQFCFTLKQLRMDRQSKEINLAKPIINYHKLKQSTFPGKAIPHEPKHLSLTFLK